jgi:ABC transporter substrate binding protein
MEMGQVQLCLPRRKQTDHRLGIISYLPNKYIHQHCNFTNPNHAGKSSIRQRLNFSGTLAALE